MLNISILFPIQKGPKEEEAKLKQTFRLELKIGKQMFSSFKFEKTFSPNKFVHQNDDGRKRGGGRKCAQDAANRWAETRLGSQISVRGEKINKKDVTDDDRKSGMRKTIQSTVELIFNTVEASCGLTHAAATADGRKSQSNTGCYTHTEKDYREKLENNMFSLQKWLKSFNWL